MIGIARLVTSTRPNTLVSKMRAPRFGGHHLERKVVALDARVVHEHAQTRRQVRSSTGRSRRADRRGLVPSPPPRELRAVGGIAHRRDDVEARARRARSQPPRPIPRPAPVTTAIPLASMFRSIRAAFSTGRLRAPLPSGRCTVASLGTVPPLGPALHPRARALPRRRARLARRPPRRAVRGRARSRRARATSTRCSTSGGSGSRSSAATAGSGSAGPPSTAAAARRSLEQVIFYEEYARAGGPGRVGIIGEGLLGPTIVHFGTDAQKQRVPPRHPRAAPRSGARATPSPTRAPTSPTCRPAPSSTATSG